MISDGNCKKAILTSAVMMFFATSSIQGTKSSLAKNISMKIDRRACFGAGCYWGTEKFFKSDFNKLSPSSRVTGAVGFMGPPSAKKNPTCILYFSS